MIVSHARQFIFVAVPKTGSQSVRLALRPHLGEYDWEQCGLFEQKRFPVPALAAIGHGHISCQQLQPFLFPEVWQRYRKFAFVRNPFQRFRSLVNFWFGANTIEPDLLGRLKNLLTNAETRGHPLIRPQSDFVCGADGELLVDDLGQFATLPEDFGRITSSLRLSAGTLPVRNASPAPACGVEFDLELREMIADFYRADFSLSGSRTLGASPC